MAMRPRLFLLAPPDANAAITGDADAESRPTFATRAVRRLGRAGASGSDARTSPSTSATQWHRLENPGKTPLELSYLGEDDIVRRDEGYVRAERNCLTQVAAFTNP
jgi:hypothetical protein